MKKAKYFWLISCNFLFIIIDIIILLTVLFLFFSTLLFFVGIICYGRNCDNIVFDTIRFLFRYNDITLEGLITCFGVFSSVSLVPIVSYFVSSHVANKNNNNRISEALAEAESVNFYVATMPFGIWTGLEESYYDHCIKEGRQIDDCPALMSHDYCLHLVFKGKIFQSYKIDVLNIGYEEYFEDGLQLKKAKQNIIHLSDTFTTDTTGTFCGAFVEGTSVIALVNDRNVAPLNYLLSAPLNGMNKNIFYEVHIEQRDETEKHPFRQMFKPWENNLRYFPLIRCIYQFSIKHHRRITSYRFDMSIDSLPTDISGNRSKYQMAIADLDIRMIRKASKCSKKS